MFLKHLSLTNFRSFARLDTDTPRNQVLILGGNAQGKTSLLEAIYYLATFTSFHASSDRQLINFFAARDPLAVARLVGTFERGEKSHRIEVRIIQETSGYPAQPRVRKEILLDGVKMKVGDVVGKFNAVLFLPQMLEMVEGAPEERRRYLNLALAQVLPRYADTLSDYTRGLTQRNALLRQLQERGGDLAQLSFWDEQITLSGSQLIHARIQAIHEIERLARKFHHELTRGGEVLRLVYQPSFDPLPKPNGQFSLPLETPISRQGITPEQIRAGFKERLEALRREEIARGITSIGPHRDELRFMENGIDLGIYGSRGQVRTAVLALKLAEVAWMKEKSGEWPVLLLDEVLAELDQNRRMDLLSRLGGSEQAFMTTTDLDLFKGEFIEHTTIWQINAGQLQRGEEGEGYA